MNNTPEILNAQIKMYQSITKTTAFLHLVLPLIFPMEQLVL